MQSALTQQTFRFPQVLQLPPPQSTSVSVPFLTPSMHLGGGHLPLHIPFSQSDPPAHIWPEVHGTQSGPPQSTSVSRAFLTESKQVAVQEVVELRMRGPALALPGLPSPQLLLAVTRYQKRPPAGGDS